jgi:MinD-like ATPase involved in chromosome partitioning or flagellar assembly
VTSSLDFGHPLMADSPDSPVRTAIRELATRLLGQPDEPPPGKQKEKERSGGFLTRIFKS